MRRRRPLILAWLASAVASAAPLVGDGVQFTTLGGHPLIPLRWTAGCGIDALYVCLDLNAVKVGYPELVNKSGMTSPGEPVDVARLWQLARDCGAHAQAIRVSNGAGVLQKIMQDTAVRTAIVHLRSSERDGQSEAEHFSAVLLVGDKLRIVGEDSYEREVAKEWETRWSGVALLVSAKPVVLAGPEGVPLPQIYIHPSKFDCGGVYTGTKVPYRFAIDNRGDGDLEITDVQTSCSCSTPTIAERLIHPKQVTTLTGLVETGPAVGRRTVRLIVFANDPERPQVPLEVTLDVKPLPMKLTPDKVVLTVSSRKERPQAAVRVEYDDPNATLRVARLEPSADWLTAELSADGQQISLGATPLESGKSSRTGTLTVHTAAPEAAVRVPVEMQLVAQVECRPTQLYLDRTSESAATIRRTIELRPRAGVTFAVAKAELRGVPGTVRRVQHVEKRDVWEVDVEFGPFGDQSGLLAGKVEISLAAEGADKIQVPVYVR
jgi:hypothetical protein